MMKKMLVLALVLAVAGLANAGLVLNPEGTGTQATVDIVGANNAKGIATFVSILGPTTSAGFNWVFTGSLKAITDQSVGTDDFDADIAAGMADAAGYTPTKIYFVEFSDGTATPPSYNGILAHWALENGTTITLHDQDDLSVLSSYTLVPEPMTMVLLGLGGLFLRKKK